MELERDVTVDDMGIAVEFKFHSYVQTVEDEWSGITDPVARRKLQNRLNQRAYRRRKVAQKQAHINQQVALRLRRAVEQSNPEMEDIVAFSDAETIDPRALCLDRSLGRSGDISYPTGLPQLQDSGYGLVTGKPGTGFKRGARSWPDTVSYSPVESSSDSFDEDSDSPGSYIQHEALEGTEPECGIHGQSGECSPYQAIRREELIYRLNETGFVFPISADHLVSLTHDRVLKALISNMYVLGLDLANMHTADCQSPFVGLDPDEHLPYIPPDLQPTLTQRTIPHHPGLDAFPDPTVRDNVILNQQSFAQYPFFMALIGLEAWQPNDPSRRAGMAVWGEPWQQCSWEITEAYLSNWSWTICGAVRLQKITNVWRARRKLKPIDFGKRFLVNNTPVMQF